MVPRGPVCLNTGVRAGSISSVLLKEAIFPDVVGARAAVVHTVLLTVLVQLVQAVQYLLAGPKDQPGVSRSTLDYT